MLLNVVGNWLHSHAEERELTMEEHFKYFADLLTGIVLKSFKMGELNPNIEEMAFDKPPPPKKDDDDKRYKGPLK